MKTEKPLKIGMISLGCEKNRIDGEVMLAQLTDAGYEICADEEDCDVIIVHTCTFIDKANEESIENILHAAQLKQTGKLKKLIVTGCMAERFKDEIFESIPEVDAVLGSKGFGNIVDAVGSENGKFRQYVPLTESTPEGARMLTSSEYSVYLKLADGCSNHCSYCIIPSVRGEFQPRERENILAEARDLAANGAKEINLIAQDTTAYPELCSLIDEISGIDGIKWIRILYCRPEEISDELLEKIAQNDKVCKYIDVPLQHASGRILKLMNRSMDDKSLEALMAKIRRIVPGVSLRTTFITGFPKETEEDFEILCEFVKRVGFNNLGVFTYSKEAGTPASRMHGQIPQDVKQKRADIVMNLQMTCLEKINAEFIGKTFDVLCEGYDEQKDLYCGRAYFQAPDIDGRTYFKAPDGACEGEFVRVKFDKADIYDFYGHTVD